MSHWVHPRLAVMAAICGILFASCGRADGGAGSTQMAPSDPRAVAIQKALDAKPPDAKVTGNVACDSRVLTVYRRLSQWQGHFTPVPSRISGQKCAQFIWKPGAGRPYIPIGRIIVDKVGDDEQRPGFGTMVTVTPFRAHFEASALGESLLKEHLATTPANLTDGLAVMHKDADGQWIAQV